MALVPSRISTPAAITGATALLIGALQYFVAQVVTAAAWRTPYSWRSNWISDLGNTRCGPFTVPHGVPAYVCSPLHAVMNASFVASGLLFLIGVLALWHLWPTHGLAAAGKVLLLVSGALKPLVGIAPENTNVDLHLLGALNLPVASIGILLLSIAGGRLSRGFGRLGIATAVVGLVGVVLSTVSQYRGEALTLGLGYGGMERVADYPGFVWAVVLGAMVLVAVARGRAHQVDRRGLAREGVGVS